MTGRRGAVGPVLVALALLGPAACGERTTRPAATEAEILAARGTAEGLLQQDRLEEARAAYEELAAMAPRDAAGHAGLGLIALREGTLDEAERRLDEARDLAPEDPDLDLALARLREEQGDVDAARRLLESVLAEDSSRVRALWALAELDRREESPAAPARIDRLRRIVSVAPANLAARVELTDALLAAGETDAAVAELEAFRGIAPDPPPRAAEALRQAEDIARAGEAGDAAERFAAFRDVFEVTGAYQAGLSGLRGPVGVLDGIPRFSFSYVDNLRVPEEDAVLASLRFAEASSLAGLEELPAPDAAGTAGALGVGDFDNDGDQDLVWSTPAGTRLLEVQLGRFVPDDAGLLPAAGAADLVPVDLDDDRRLDLFAVGSDPAVYRQLPDGGFEALDTEGVPSGGGARRGFAADLDQDGDLDLFAVGPGENRWFRNDGDLTFTEMGAEAGLAGSPAADTRDADFADVDADGDLDVVLAAGDGLRLLRNERGGRFVDATEISGLGSPDPVHALALGDFDNDGHVDVLAALEGGVARLRGSGDGTFEPAAGVSAAGLAPRDLATLDFDNDGWLDFAVGGAASEGGGLRLYRNTRDGGFESADDRLPAPVGEVSRIRVLDYNEDGDADLLLLDGTGAPRLLRNDGGNAHHFLRLDLVGLGDGSRKNNRFGIGARVEVRAGDLYQVRTVRTPGLLVGLDGHLKADVVRVTWPNGVPQDIYFPGTDQDLIEQQTLKGSCPLLYTWNGEAFEFVGDVMWKSALGMPLGILGGDGTQRLAPAFPSQEYRRLPAGSLAPRDGEYVMQLTEELWETIYVDEVRLVAVDHPAATDVFVNERFVPPAPTDLKLWSVGGRHAPVSARDGRGVDHLAALAARDFEYVDNLRPGRFQGIAEPHELILDLGPAAADGDVVLFLTGWVFPTDASINVAMSQSGRSSSFPALDVIGPDGDWVTAIEDLGIPSGKDKTVIADLRGRFPTADRRVRIRTDLMVYWDEAFFTVDDAERKAGPWTPATGSGTPVAASEVREAASEVPVAAGDAPETAGGALPDLRVTRLSPAVADLHYRGFSREFRKGGRHGPHWFDYGTVSREPRWHDLSGTYTRYGDVTPLLEAGDDRYVVANAGDEITLRFDAEGLPALPEGWTRTFLVYTDGWVKDGDLNTRTGDRVEPLPFRAQTRYPYGPDESYPDGPAYRDYLETYQTREVEPGR